MTKLISLLSALLLILASNVKAGDGVAQSSLSKPAELTHFTLPATVTLSTSVKNAFGHKAHLAPILMKGEYISVFSDSIGTFYQGPKDCLPNPYPSAVFRALDGGVWIPKDSSQLRPKLWFYLKPMPASFRAGLLIRAIDKVSAGNVKKDPADIDDLSFMVNIAIQPYQVPAVEQGSNDRQ